MFPDLITELLQDGYKVNFNAPGHSMFPTIMANEIIMVESTQTNQDQTPATPPVLDFEVNIDPEELNSEGWSISYDLPEATKGAIDNDH